MKTSARKISSRRKEGRVKKPRTMEQRLRSRFIRTAMLSLFIILMLILGFLNILNFVQIEKRADSTLTMLRDNGGHFPERDESGSKKPGDGPSPKQNTSLFSLLISDFSSSREIEAPFETRYFCVTLDADGELVSSDLANVAAVTEDVAVEYAQDAYSSSRTSGFVGGYRYLLTENDDGTTQILFVDCGSDLAQANALLRISLLIGVAALILMYFLVRIFAGAATAPVVESLEKQKRFISDAGHELKTPLTIISANVDVLEMTGTKNEWTGSIKNQVKRMTSLITNMLTLTRMEEEASRELYQDINFSETVKEAVKGYEAVAASMGKHFTWDIQDNVHIFGEPRSMEQLCGLLLDNAMKYSAPEGSIHLSLTADRKIRFEVANTCESGTLPEGNLDRLFDRFYRADKSRSSNGSFGIGLSAARAICQGHGGSIGAARDGDSIIRFTAVLPLYRPEKKAETKEIPAKK